MMIDGDNISYIIPSSHCDSSRSRVNAMVSKTQQKNKQKERSVSSGVSWVLDGNRKVLTGYDLHCRMGLDRSST